ncbi:MAG: tRNA (adenosine(37)-N6)-dimethylallyltransferase MiaA [Rhizobiaceae bacterium]|nr:tRNA (adenosine(37)-N6)-dimethylallyltransferase MiaA [Rhizobiaceae bacterium]
MKPDAILIAGPTASGKSDLAINLAKANNGVVINADSMQVYEQLNIITARPTANQMSQCTHRLYGHRDAGDAYSVAIWLKEAKGVLSEVKEQGRVPVFVGGTGLYFRGLTEGLSPVPELDNGIRQKWRDFALDDGERLYDELVRRDELAAKQLRPSDHQRLIRALEVIDSTGKSIIEWQSENKGEPLLGGSAVQKILLMPQRSILHKRIEDRFERMVDEGAPGEVAQLLELEIEPTLPVMKAIGVPQFSKYLAGEITKNEAIEKAKAATRQYAKRQSTWFNNQFGEDWHRQE